jgi:methylated-DNA-[protein]-cysteine S-methyltransferase
MTDTRQLQNRLFVFSTDIGYMALATRSERVVRLSMGFQNQLAAFKAASDWGAESKATVAELAIVETLKSYASGRNEDLSEIPIELLGFTPFRRKVSLVCQKIGYGETLTYAGLAKKAGSPNASRAVGTVMSRNPIPLIIPCHRVVASGGKIGGFSAPQGTQMKLALLHLEQNGSDPLDRIRSKKKVRLAEA